MLLVPAHRLRDPLGWLVPSREVADTRLRPVGGGLALSSLKGLDLSSCAAPRLVDLFSCHTALLLDALRCIPFENTDRTTAPRAGRVRRGGPTHRPASARSQPETGVRGRTCHRRVLARSRMVGRGRSSQTAPPQIAGAYAVRVRRRAGNLPGLRCARAPGRWDPAVIGPTLTVAAGQTTTAPPGAALHSGGKRNGSRL